MTLKRQPLPGVGGTPPHVRSSTFEILALSAFLSAVNDVPDKHAQRKAGQLLARMPKRNGGSAARESLGNSALPRLREVLDTETDGEAKMRAKRRQDVAAVPEDVWADYTANAKEPTRAGLLKEARP